VPSFASLSAPDKEMEPVIGSDCAPGVTRLDKPDETNVSFKPKMRKENGQLPGIMSTLMRIVTAMVFVQPG